MTTNKISGFYKIIDCGFIKFYDIKINDEYLNKNKIPNIDSILNHSDNINHILKIIKIFINQDNFKTKSNHMGNINFLNLIEQYSQ